MMYSKVIYTSLIKTEIGTDWNSGGYFHRACAICEKSWWKAPENSGLASDYKKMIRKFNSIICRFFASYSQDNVFSLLYLRHKITK